MKEENILALDASSKSTGYCIRNNSKEIIKYGSIQSSSTILLKRLSIMEEEITKLIKEYNIDIIVLEDVPGGNIGNNHTQIVLLNLQGIIMLAAYKNNPKIKIELMQSSTWRSRIGIETGQGITRERLKKEDIKYAETTYNLKVKNDDEADAICLSDAYYKKSKDINWK